MRASKISWTTKKRVTAPSVKSNREVSSERRAHSEEPRSNPPAPGPDSKTIGLARKLKSPMVEKKQLTAQKPQGAGAGNSEHMAQGTKQEQNMCPPRAGLV